MDITPRERDALIEVANIGMSRAAAQLSLLLNDAISVHVPQVYVTGVAAIRELLELDADESAACVRQELGGFGRGASLLMFHPRESQQLVSALLGSLSNLTEIDRSLYEHEAIMELGNVIISSAIAVLADILGEEIRLSTPAFVEGDIGDLLKLQGNSADNSAVDVIVMKARLTAAQRGVVGHLAIMLDAKVVKGLLQKVGGGLQG